MELSAQGAAPAYFSALLERGKKRTSENGLPQLELGLQDISRKVRNLGKGGPSAHLRADAKAHYLLSASGVNTSQALRDLEELTGTATPATARTQQDAGVRDVVAQTHQTDFQKMVDNHIKRAYDEFDLMIEERLQGVDWNAHRQRIYEHFGLKKPSNGDGGLDTSKPAAFGQSSRRSRFGAVAADGSTYGLPGMSRSVIGTAGPRGARNSMFGDIADKASGDGLRSAAESSVLRRKQEKYGNRVKDLNVARLQKGVYPVLTRFSEVEADSPSDDSSILINAYKALVCITGENPGCEQRSEPSYVKERQYASDYLNETPNSSGQIGIRKRILDGSRTFLEKLFLSQIDSTVAKNPKEANIGGVPTALAKVKGYVRVRAARKELGSDLEILQEVNGDYCWPLMFYLLRSGLFEEAAAYVEENAAAFRQIDRQFMRYIKAYASSPERRLPPEMQTTIANEYSQRQRLAPEDSIDPYRMMCYKVVGRCDLARRSLENITTDMMDWIWLQFSLAREYNRVDEFANEAFSLEDVRLAIKDVGDRYFGPGSDIANAPMTLFFMQILAGKFEIAVAGLYAHNYLSAVHFAIALDFYGLLRVADISSSDDLLTNTTRQQPQIAFGSMLGLYTRDFRTADATCAVDYITLICLNADLTGSLGKAQRDLCYQALTEIVLETREFAQLLGDIRADGQRIKGAIEQRLSLIGLDGEQAFLKHITQVAAKTAEEQDRTTDSALLYHLAEDYNKVFQIVNDAVSIALTADIGEAPVRIVPLLPRNIQDRNNQDKSQNQTSLSLTAVDDPIQLARDIRQLYASDAMYINKIERKHRDACDVLLQLAKARSHLETKMWPQAVDAIASSEVIPLQANGNMSAIRGKAQAFEQMPTSIARTVGHVMVWTVVALSNEVKRLKSTGFDTEFQQSTISTCVRSAKDVMVFAGLIRYKMPGRVWESLALASQDIGAY